MPIFGPLDHIPLWVLFGGTVAIVLLLIEGGYRLGRYRRRHCEDEKEAPVGAIVAATLGLLGFVLAFTFGLAASRFDTRRQIVVEEANAIGTTYLCAGLLPDGRDEKIRKLLGEYVNVPARVRSKAETSPTHCGGRRNCIANFGRRQKRLASSTPARLWSGCSFSP